MENERNVHSRHISTGIRTYSRKIGRIVVVYRLENVCATTLFLSEGLIRTWRLHLSAETICHTCNGEPNWSSEIH